MGGSSGVEPPYEVTPLEGIQKALAGKAEVESISTCLRQGPLSPSASPIGSRSAASEA